MDKKIIENLSDVQLQLYYKEQLSRTEKSQLLKYLMVQFDYSYASIQSKLTGKAEMNKRDLILIGETINSESWRM